VTDIAFGIAGVVAAIDRIRANTDLCPRIDLTMSVARTGQTARRVTAAAIRIFEAQVARDVAAARGLTNRDARRARCAQPAAAISAARAQHPVDFRAVRRSSGGRGAGTDGLARRDGARCRAAIGITTTRIAGLNAERCPERADLIGTAQTGAAIAVVHATVARSAAAVVERRASLVRAAASAAARVVTRAGLAVGDALSARTFAGGAAERTTIRGRSASCAGARARRYGRNTACFRIAVARAAVTSGLAGKAHRMARGGVARRARARSRGSGASTCRRAGRAGRAAGRAARAATAAAA